MLGSPMCWWFQWAWRWWVLVCAICHSDVLQPSPQVGVKRCSVLDCFTWGNVGGFNPFPHPCSKNILLVSETKNSRTSWNMGFFVFPTTSAWKAVPSTSILTIPDAPVLSFELVVSLAQRKPGCTFSCRFLWYLDGCISGFRLPSYLSSCSSLSWLFISAVLKSDPCHRDQPALRWAEYSPKVFLTEPVSFSHIWLGGVCF